jgi:hypothetical protein
LGNGGQSDAFAPMPVLYANTPNGASLGPLPQPARVSVGGSGFTCAMSDDGRVFCWGDNTSGQLGLGNVGNAVLLAAPVSL